MALATYFDKAALSAASLLREVDYSTFAQLLDTRWVELCFDDSAVESAEGRVSLEVFVNLCARLYPNFHIAPAKGASARALDFAVKLNETARKINPVVSQSLPTPDMIQVTVVVGRTPLDESGKPLYLGSSGWIAKVSDECAVGSGSGLNPFGAAAASCFAAAKVFRRLFADHLQPESAPSAFEFDSLAIDLVDMSRVAVSREDQRPFKSDVDIGETYLVGVGAIGNATTWVLGQLKELRGDLHLVDHEQVEIGNLQRYMLASIQDVGINKVTCGKNVFAQGAHLRVHSHACTWETFVAASNNYRFDRMLLALDSAGDRMAAQSSLPRWIVNAWTQPANLGVSRHPNFLTHPCVTCLYLPTDTRQSEDSIYADALGAQGQQELMEIRTRLYDGAPVGLPFIHRVADRLGVSGVPLECFANLPIQAFYTQALCGGIVLRLGGSAAGAKQLEVPMAFQSALAGILLAVELITDAAEVRPSGLPCRTEFDLLRDIGTSFNVPTAKHASGRCICEDPIFLDAYRKKYQ